MAYSYPYSERELAKYDKDRQKEVTIPIGYLDDLREGAVAGWREKEETREFQRALVADLREARAILKQRPATFKVQWKDRDPGAAVGGYRWER